MCNGVITALKYNNALLIAKITELTAIIENK